MKATITRPDGTKIEIDGSEAEVRNVLAYLSPAPYYYQPNIWWKPPSYYYTVDGNPGVTLTTNGQINLKGE